MDTAYKTTLELDKVLNRAVQLCACQETKEMMQALEPAPTIEDERYDLTQTNAINALLIKNGSPRFGSVREVRRIVAHARKGVSSRWVSCWKLPRPCAISRACPSGTA
ncbi:hypothetical protein NIA69_14105 [Gemmiger formicilis]|nr:hypothetical protein [Gemmiger formicilis]